MPIASVLLALTLFQSGPKLGSVDLFGQTGLDEKAIRSAIPLHPGDTLAMDRFGLIVNKISDQLKTKRIRLTDLSLVGVDTQGNMMLFVGVEGPSTRSPRKLLSKAGVVFGIVQSLNLGRITTPAPLRSALESTVCRA